ncbi:MAG: DNA polymerase III subunit delta' [Caulobacterales bacterium 68-7]|nr:DNA polymerase III subunit delta' [Caulobacterales bacterium]OJU12877.1 MAG: DNA polymerase III subunit delta' [Caulobacterales bacterium 68-7]
MAFNPADLPHPRDTFSLEGVEAADAAFLEALSRGRLHHAWLLTGPEGVGKASFAYRAARRLLGARPDPLYGPLGVSPHDPVSRQVSARSHPDLMVLERIGEDGKPRKVIPVDEARRLPEFFSKAPGSAPYRVAIIDAADDLNVNSANAVLKTLEEPPERGVLFLISHTPGGLLPTIRSRCRRLAIAPLDEARAAERTAAITGVSDEDAAALAHMARGAIGQALRLSASGALEADREAREILRALPGSDPAALLALADSFRGGEGMARFTQLFERLADQVHAMATRDAAEGRGEGLERWAEAWALLRRMPEEAEALNLDRADSLFTAVRELRRAAS